MKGHDLKIWPEFYQLVIDDIKPFEIRKNDRDFQVGDIIHLREWRKDSGFTGRSSRWQIRYVLLQAPGLMPGYCILGLYGPWSVEVAA